MGLEGFSMAPLVRELSGAIIGGRIDKISQPNKHTVILGVRQPGEYHRLHISINSQNSAAYLIEKNLENLPTPPVFCMVLRKHIEGGRIGALRQAGLDRLLFLDIDCLSEGGRIVTKTLALELMGKYSNIILMEDGKIIDAMRKIGEANSRVRTVLPGVSYEPPPPQDKINLFTTDIAAVISHLKTDSEARLDKALLAVCLGFGPITAKEVCFSAGLAPSTRIETLEAVDFSSIERALLEIRDACRDEIQPVLLINDAKKVLAMASYPLHYLPDAMVLTFPTISKMLEKADALMGSYIIPDKERFKRFVKTELKRAKGKLAKLEEEILAAENADEYKIKGDNLQTYQYAYKDRENAKITVSNIYSETGKEITIDLDQRHTLIENMQAYYKKYDKLKRAQELLQIQKRECQESIDYLESVDASLIASESLAEINEIHNELISAGYLHEKPKRKNNDKPARLFHFLTPDGTNIFIGKNNLQNDRLTTKTARFNDTWFHTKDTPGSHVLLQNGGAPLTEENIRLAASLAVHFSKAAGSSNVPVDYVEVRYIKKPSGAKPGFVIFTNQKTIYITEGDTDLKPILAQEN